MPITKSISMVKNWLSPDALRLASSVAVVLCIFTMPASACDLPRWQSRYDILKFGTTIAQLDMSLTVTDNTATYRLHTETVGLLGVFSDEELTETSTLVQTGNRNWQLRQFSQERAEKKSRNQKFSLEYADSVAVARGEHNEKPFELKTSTPVWDRSSVQLALGCDLMNETTPRDAYDYAIIDGASIGSYHFENLGQETIRIADRKFDTRKLQRSSGDRKTILWLDPGRQFMPVRIEQHKKGELHLRMDLDL